MVKKLLPLFLFLIYLFVGLFFLTDYGINWDEPNRFIRGQAFLYFFLSGGKRDYQEVRLLEWEDKTYRFDWGYEFQDEKTDQTVRQSIYQYYYPPSFYWRDIEKRASHPPFSDILAAFSNFIFFQKLGIAPDVHSYNFYPIFLSAVLVTAVYIWTRKIYGSFAGLIAALSLALYPLFLGERHFNIKDVPQAVFFSLALFSFWEAIVKKSFKHLVIFSLFASFAFSTKFNFGFAIFIIFPWLVVLAKKGWRPNFKKHKRFWIYFLCVPLIILGFLILSWPAIWFRPEFLWASISYHKGIGTSPRPSFSAYALKYILFTTPVVTLFLSFLGLLFGFFFLAGKQKQGFWLVLFWFLVPILRVVVPKTSIYGGLRQIMEFIPAMAILSGIGANQLGQWLVKAVKLKVKSKRKLLITNYLLLITFLLFFFPITLKMILIHPNESVFFNQLIGGLKGAQEKNIPDAGLSLGNPYRQGIKWINKNVESGAKLAFGYELMSNIPRLWVRNDIKFDNQVKSGPARQGEYVISVITGTNPRLSWYRMRYLEKFLEPVYQVEVDGVPLLKVWKNDVEHTRKEYLEEEEIKGVNLEIKETFLTITLPQSALITRVELVTDDKKYCQELVDVSGSFVLFPDEKTKQALVLPATVHDFAGKVKRPRPFLLLAAEEAKIIRLNFAKNNTCFGRTRAVRVYKLKNLEP